MSVIPFDPVLTFVPDALSGSMSGTAPSFDAEAAPTYVRKRGPASNFLEKRGFGWLMEEDDADEDSLRPLM